MNWFRENKYLAIALGVLILLIGGLGYLVLGEMSDCDAARQSYTSKVQTLIGMRSLSPYRDLGNLKKIQDQEAQYESLADGLQTDLAGRQTKMVLIDPAAFQSRLRETVSAVTAHAQDKGVDLPKDFYLSFDSYQKELPKNELAPLLNWQLTAINDLITQMIDLHINSISLVERAPVPDEANVVSPPKIAAPPNALPLLFKYPVHLSLVSYQNNVQSLLNYIATSNQFMIIRAVKVENEQRQGPLRNPPAAAAPDAAANPVQPAVDVGSAEATKPTPTNRIIVGTEKIKVDILLDLIQFPPSPVAGPTDVKAAKK